MILNYLSEIEKAVENNLYIIALTAALGLPDICACLEATNPNNTNKVGERYKKWYKKYAKSRCLLDEETCYKYRCSMVHSNNSVLDSSYEKVAFFLPPVNSAFNNCTIDISIKNNNGDVVTEKAKTIDYETFVYGMIESVKEWRKTALNNLNYQKNAEYLLQIRPTSMLGVLSGDLAVY